MSILEKLKPLVKDWFDKTEIEKTWDEYLKSLEK